MKKRILFIIRRKGWITFIVIFCVLILIEVLFDYISWIDNVIGVEKIRHALPLAMHTWQSKEISDYTVDVYVNEAPGCNVDARLIVKDNELVTVLVLDNARDITSDWKVINPTEWDIHRCHFRDMPIQEMFRRVEQILNRINTADISLDVAFDPEYGFIKIFVYGIGYRHGVMSPFIVDGYAYYEFTNFQPNENVLAP